VAAGRRTSNPSLAAEARAGENRRAAPLPHHQFSSASSKYSSAWPGSYLHRLADDLKLSASPIAPTLHIKQKLGVCEIIFLASPSRSSVHTA